VKISKKIQAFAYLIKGDALYVKKDYKGAVEAYKKALPGLTTNLNPMLSLR
jgi:predicted negative regulator of RcsB-dependent stress response